MFGCECGSDYGWVMSIFMSKVRLMLSMSLGCIWMCLLKYLYEVCLVVICVLSIVRKVSMSVVVSG